MRLSLEIGGTNIIAAIVEDLEIDNLKELPIVFETTFFNTGYDDSFKQITDFVNNFDEGIRN